MIQSELSFFQYQIIEFLFLFIKILNFFYFYLIPIIMIDQLSANISTIQV